MIFSNLFYFKTHTYLLLVIVGSITYKRGA